jgi:hypothetical protein
MVEGIAASIGKSFLNSGSAFGTSGATRLFLISAKLARLSLIF